MYCLDALTGVSIWETPLGGATFSVIGIEDCTGDGQPDVVAGASNEDETIGYVYGINGDTGAIIWTFTTSATSVWALEQIDDISHDSIKDIIIGEFYTTSGTIYGLDSTTGNDLWNNSLGYVLIARFEKIDDLNNDGHPDIIPALLNTNEARAIDGTNGDIIWSNYLADQPYQVAATSDITGDGAPDLVVGTTFTENYCYWLDGTNGSVVHSINLGTPIDAITAIPDVVGDMNSTMEMVAGGRNGFVACFSGGGEIMSSQQTVNLTLHTGWNMVTVPLENSWTAESLGENISGCTLVLMFDAASQSFVTHVVGTPWDDFPIVDGVGYFVYVSQNSSLGMTDLPISDISVPISMEWNIIGWPHDASTHAESLGENLTGCTLVLMFDAETQVFTTHVVGTPWDNFVVPRGMGLFVYATSESIWTGEG